MSRDATNERVVRITVRRHPEIGWEVQEYFENGQALIFGLGDGTREYTIDLAPPDGLPPRGGYSKP